MVDQMQISRRSILAGAALAGALAPVLATTSAWGQGAMRKASAAEIAALPRQKVKLVDPLRACPQSGCRGRTEGG